MEKAYNVIRISYKTINNFFTYWLTFLKPFHKLTTNEISVASSLLQKRYELSQKITDDNLLNQVLFSRDTRKEIRELINIDVQVFQVVMTSLRKKKFLVDNRINPKYIPNYNEDSNQFSLLLYFDKVNEQPK